MYSVYRGFCFIIENSKSLPFVNRKLKIPQARICFLTEITKILNKEVLPLKVGSIYFSSTFSSLSLITINIIPTCQLYCTFQHKLILIFGNVARNEIKDIFLISMVKFLCLVTRLETFPGICPGEILVLYC